MKKYKDLIVHYESWQYECCGTPFKVGDVVQWTAYKDGDEYWYDAHANFKLQIEGKIVEIVALYRTVIGDINSFRVLGERIESITDSESAFDLYETQTDLDSNTEREDFYCYIVNLVDVKISEK